MKRVIFVAYDMSPTQGSEAGRAYVWKSILTKKYPLDIYVDAIHARNITEHSEIGAGERYHYVEGMKPWRRLRRYTGLWNIPTIVFTRKVRRLIKKLSPSEYSLIHCITPAGIYSYNDLYKVGLPIVIGPLGGALPTPRGFPSVFGRFYSTHILRDAFYRFLVKVPGWKRYIRNAKCVVVGNAEMKNRLPSGFRGKCVTIFDAVVDINKFRPLENRGKNSRVVVLFSGRLVPSKGVKLLINAAEKVLRERKTENFVVQIAGNGPLYREAASLITRRGLASHVSLLGQLSKSQMLEHFQHADIFCLPTLREPGGNAILEAMACGLPIISSDYGGPSVSVSADCGFKIPVHTESQYVEDLAEALCRLITDEHLRTDMGRNARARAVEEFSVAALESKIIDLYDGVVPPSSESPIDNVFPCGTIEVRSARATVAAHHELESPH